MPWICTTPSLRFLKALPTALFALSLAAVLAAGALPTHAHGQTHAASAADGEAGGNVGVHEDLTCAYCGGPIVGPYVTALGKTWHPEHFVCTHCRRPFSENTFYEKDGLPYCHACYFELFSPRCAVCGEPIRSTYLQNVWGDLYCAGHEDEFERCYSCGRLICDRLTRGGVEYDDGRWMCNLCRRTAVDDADDAREVLEDVRRTLGRLGLGLGDVEIPLRLVDKAELDRIEGDACDPNGNTVTCVLRREGRVIDRVVEEIEILHGLPREHFATIAAHECGHAWLFLERFPDLPPLVEEGICELFAHLWLEQQHTREAVRRMRMMENNEDPVYGEGLRTALRSLDVYSVPALLAYVRLNADFPPGF